MLTCNLQTEKCGSGIVADEDIKRGEFVIEYVGEGEVLSLFACILLKNNLCFVHSELHLARKYACYCSY